MYNIFSYFCSTKDEGKKSASNRIPLHPNSRETTISSNESKNKQMESDVNENEEEVLLGTSEENISQPEILQEAIHIEV